LELLDQPLDGQGDRSEPRKLNEGERGGERDRGAAAQLPPGERPLCHVRVRLRVLRVGVVHGPLIARTRRKLRAKLARSDGKRAVVAAVLCVLPNAGRRSQVSVPTSTSMPVRRRGLVAALVAVLVVLAAASTANADFQSGRGLLVPQSGGYWISGQV